LLEFYEKSDMLLANLSTMAGDQLLETAGMIHVEALQKENQLQLGNNVDMDVEFAQDSLPDDMQLFQGDMDSTGVDWLAMGGVPRYYGEVVFEPVDDYFYPSDSIYNLTQEQRELNSRVFRSRRLGWINCDRFIRDRDLTNLRVRTKSQEFVPQTYLVFHNINSIMRPARTYKNGGVFYNIPRSQTVSVIAFALHDDIYYFGVEEKIKISNPQLHLELAPMDKKSFERRIRSFDF
jgi:hypothetical protein